MRENLLALISEGKLPEAEKKIACLSPADKADPLIQDAECRLMLAKSDFEGALGLAFTSFRSHPRRRENLDTLVLILERSGNRGFARVFCDYCRKVLQLSCQSGWRTPDRPDPVTVNRLQNLIPILSNDPDNIYALKSAIPLLCEVNMEKDAHRLLSGLGTGFSVDVWISFYSAILNGIFGPALTPAQIVQNNRAKIQKTKTSLIVAGMGRCGTTTAYESLIGYGFHESPHFLNRFSDLKPDGGGFIYKTHDFPPASLPPGFKVIFLFGDPIAIALSAHKMINYWGREHFLHMNAGPFIENDNVLRGDPMQLHKHFESWMRPHPFPVLALRYPDVFTPESVRALQDFLGLDVDLPPFKERETKAEAHPLYPELQATFQALREIIRHTPKINLLEKSEAVPARSPSPPDADLWTGLFDKVYVLSLRSSQERRDHVRRHLPLHGIHEFEFFDATPGDDPLVEKAFQNGEVVGFPPCFRCGKIECEDPDCNNFLTPPQVATFISYRRLWEKISDNQAERILVVEDDIQFHAYLPDALRHFKEMADLKTIPFAKGESCLVRLGWARCEDHDGKIKPHFTTQKKMSNPCHALTREYAKNLLARYKGIVHTVDTYQHDLAPLPGESFTLMPPIASELSWTEGVFASTIRPKEAHAEFLRSQGDLEGAAKYEKALAHHVKKKYFRPLLIVGHPRCGTGYAAALCQQLKLDVGHEKLGKDGISSWMFAVEADENPYALDSVARTRKALAWKHMILPVRDLADAAGSVMREELHAPPSYRFRREHLIRLKKIDLEDYELPLERALMSVILWTKVILDQNPSICFRIEDQHGEFLEFLAATGLSKVSPRDVALDTSPVNSDKAYRGVHYPKPEVKSSDWERISIPVKAEIAWYCSRFGYRLP